MPRGPKGTGRLSSPNPSLDSIQRAVYSDSRSVEHMRVNHRRRHILVPEQLMHGLDVAAILEEVRRKRMPKRVACCTLGNPSRDHRPPHPTQVCLLRSRAEVRKAHRCTSSFTQPRSRRVRHLGVGPLAHQLDAEVPADCADSCQTRIAAQRAARAHRDAVAGWKCTHAPRHESQRATAACQAGSRPWQICFCAATLASTPPAKSLPRRHLLDILALRGLHQARDLDRCAPSPLTS